MSLRMIYEKNIYHTLLAFLISGAVAFCVNDMLLLVEAWGLFFMLVFAAAGVTALRIFRRKPALYLTLLGLAAVLMLIAMFTEANLGEALVNAFRWLFYDRSPETELALTYSIVSVGLVVCGLTGAIYVLCRWRPVRLGLGCAVLGLVVMAAVFQLESGFAGVLFAFCPILLILGEARQGAAVSWLLPFLVAGGLFVAVMPSKPEPVEWRWVKAIVQETGSLFTKIGDRLSFFFSGASGEYSVNMLGYTESSSVGGSVNAASSEREALTVRPLTQKGETLYLAGTALDYFDGRKWERRGADGDYFLDTLETVLALTAAGETAVTRSIRVTYRELYTRSVFLPGKTVEVKADIPPEQNPLRWGKMRGEGDYYSVVYLDVDKDVYAKLAGAGAEVGAFADILPELPEDYPEQLERRREGIYADFMQLPPTTPRVFALVEELTADCTSAYEKLRAMEGFLQTFTYTLTPNAPPDGRDFLDWLLFEEQSGYCTYYATALALMGRAAGVPTRYVQGLMTDFSEENAGSFLVRGKSAHAWVEGYIDGVGWVSFEPTPGYSAYHYTESPAETSPRPLPATSGARPTEIPPTGPSAEELMAQQRQAEEERGILLAGILVLAGVVVAAGAAFAVVYAGARRRYLRRIQTKDVVVQFREVLRLLGWLGAAPEAGETLAAFSARTGDEELDFCAACYEAAFYGGMACGEDELMRIFQYRQALEAKAQEKLHFATLRFAIKD